MWEAQTQASHSTAASAGTSALAASPSSPSNSTRRLWDSAELKGIQGTEKMQALKRTPQQRPLVSRLQSKGAESPERAVEHLLPGVWTFPDSAQLWSVCSVHKG